MTIDIITVAYADEAGGEPTTERYQMPLSHYAEEQGRIGHAYIGPHFDEDLGDVHSYDAVHDREAMAVYLDTFAQTPAGRPATVRRRSPSTGSPGYDLDTERALDAVQRRAEQLLGRLRRRQPDEGVPQGDARAATPTSRSTAR